MCIKYKHKKKLWNKNVQYEFTTLKNTRNTTVFTKIYKNKCKYKYS